MSAPKVMPADLKMSKKKIERFEWRCPFGEKCGMGDRIMYIADTEWDAASKGAWHLADQKVHNELGLSYEDATAEAMQGTEAYECEIDIVVNEKGDEV